MCAAILCVASSIAQAAAVEWHSLEPGPPFAPPPTSLVIFPAAPTTADTIGFIAPTDGEGGFNSYAAADQYGNPAISVDSTNRTINVTFSAPQDDPVPQIVMPVGGVDGYFGPLHAGTWTFNILTNTYTFTVVAGPSLVPPATVEWHLLMGLVPAPAPPPTSFVISPAAPTIADTISYIAPTGGIVCVNSIAAADQFGNPSISVDATNRTISVSFSAPQHYPIPAIAMPVSGLDGHFGPLKAGTWVFKILTNTFSFTVTGPPLGIAAGGNGFVIFWRALDANYVLQAANDLSTGTWSNVTSGITTDGTNYAFTNAVRSQAAFFRLQHQ